MLNRNRNNINIHTMKIFKISLVSSIIFFVLGNIALLAHPGHGSTDGHSLIHYLSEPMHAMVLAAVVLMVAGSVTWLILKKKKAAERA